MPNKQETVSHSTPTLYDLFYSNKTKKTYTNLGISLLLVIVFLAFALVPTLTTLDEIQDRIKEYKTLNEALKTKIDAIRALSIQRNTTSENNGVKEEVDFLDKAFQSDFKLNALYANLYERAKSSDVSIISLTPRYPSEGNLLGSEVLEGSPSPISYEVQVSIKGTTNSKIIAFIKQLESATNMPIPSRVKSISIIDQAESARTQPANSGQQNAASTSDITCDLTLVVYVDRSRSDLNIEPAQ